MREKVIKIRDIEQGDAKAIVSHMNNVKVVKYLTSKIPYPYSDIDADWWINEGSKEGINKIIEHNGILAGLIGVTPGQFENERSAEIGYWLAESHWGKGLATLALQQVTEMVFNTTNIVRLFAPVFGPNSASKRVLEKSGYYQEAIQRNALFKHDQFYDAYIYAKLKP
jgi:RimJ/RimL family protein N-acetyltransferase